MDKSLLNEDTIGKNQIDKFKEHDWSELSNLKGEFYFY